MNIAMFLYFVAQGFGAVSTTFIGIELGKGNLKNAWHWLRVIQFNATMIILAVSVIIYYTKEEVVASLTNIPTVYDRAMAVVWLLIFNTFPEQFKGINKGIIRGLNLQGKSVYIHLSGNWGLNICL
jgi:Na+-driven multidrug efflux pump